MSDDIVSPYDMDRAEKVRLQFHGRNDLYSVQQLLATHIVLLQDIRFHLQSLEELIRYRSQS
jgi:hypothetical protein